jgi:hypothetical protein
MSTLYYMTCHQCKKSIWVAQDGLSGFSFYSGEPACMRAYKDFLLDHQRHPLELVPEQDHDYLEEAGYVEIEWPRRQPLEAEGPR